MAMKRLEDMLWLNIKKIRDENDELFARSVLEARSDFLRLRLRQEPAIRRIYLDAADNIAKEIRDLKPTVGKLTRSNLDSLEKSLRREAEQISQGLSERLKEDLLKAVESGAYPLSQQLVRAIQESKAPLDILKVQRGFADVNAAAVEALWARTHKGMILSDRIWQTGEKARETIKAIIWDGTARGRDAVRVARDIEKYVRHGSRTFAEDYSEMMERMGGRVPKDLSYEALRLARTEMSNAYREGSYAAGRINPSYIGSRWLLSSSHPIADICDDFASADLYGLGPGGYPRGEEPPIAHPNCLCYTVPIVEDTASFTERLVSWTHDPSGDPGLEQWYNDIYQGRLARTPAIRLSTSKKPELIETAKKYRIELPDLPDQAKDRLAKAFETALQHGKTTGTETLITIDADTGEEIHPAVSGDKNSVVFPRSLIELLTDAKKNSLITVHNHPSSSSFSGDDLVILSKYESINWMTVIGHNETRYVVSVGDGMRPSRPEVHDAWVDAVTTGMDEYVPKVISGEMTEDDAWREHSSNAMELLAKKFGWDYRRLKLND